MKHILAVVLLVVSFNTSASNTSDDVYTMCDNLSGFASAVMESRQHDVSMSSVIESIKENKEKLGGDIEPYVELVLIAYDSPYHESKAHKQRRIKEYANTVHVACLKNLMGNTVKN